jgi:hypothetical protein
MGERSFTASSYTWRAPARREGTGEQGGGAWPDGRPAAAPVHVGSRRATRPMRSKTSFPDTDQPTPCPSTSAVFFV